MTKWYEGNRQFFEKERGELARSHPFLKLEVCSAGTRLNEKCSLPEEAAVVTGSFMLTIPDTPKQYGYTIALVLPNEYPRRPPSMFCDDDTLPIGEIDRHIMRDGQACLGIYGDIDRRWQSSRRLVAFVDEIVAPFIAWQFIYDQEGGPPSWGGRPHGSAGVLEYYAERLGLPVGPSIEEFMKLLAHKKIPGGHESCPCGSGRQLRNCHRSLVRRVWKESSCWAVAEDLKIIEWERQVRGGSFL